MLVKRKLSGNPVLDVCADEEVDGIEVPEDVVGATSHYDAGAFFRKGIHDLGGLEEYLVVGRKVVELRYGALCG